jgi:hypothetical protein
VYSGEYAIPLLSTWEQLFLLPPRPDRLWVQPSLIYNGYQSSLSGIRRPGPEANHQPPCSSKVKNACSYTSTPPYVCVTWFLVKHTDSFSLHLSPNCFFLLSVSPSIQFIYLIIYFFHPLTMLIISCFIITQIIGILKTFYGE